MAAPISGSGGLIFHNATPPWVKPPRVSSSALPGPWITPSRVTLFITTILPVGTLVLDRSVYYPRPGRNGLVPSLEMTSAAAPDRSERPTRAARKRAAILEAAQKVFFAHGFV